VRKQFLHAPDVVAVLDPVLRERVPQRVGARALRDASLAHGRLHRPLQDRFVQVMAAALARQPVAADAGGGEHPLPAPFPAHARVLSQQGGR
jgi:hypothetical protein